MKVGVMGGTFDPIHNGHLRGAENARAALGLQRVLFVPAGQPPHREPPLASALDRFAMVCLATAGQPAFIPCDAELRRPGPSYTVDTLEGLRVAFPDDRLVLILGADTAPLQGWRSPERIQALCEIAVVARPGSPAAAAVDGAGLDISASQVRERARRREPLHDLVPGSVAEYIDKRGLYR